MKTGLCFAVIICLFFTVGKGLGEAIALNDTVDFPNTYFCYAYNGTACKEAIAKNSPETTLSRVCNLRQEVCKPEKDQITVCLAIWEQRKNDSLPEHVDRSLNATLHLGCFNQRYIDIASGQCNPECVASSLTVLTNYTYTRCCCTLELCNDITKRVLNISSADIPNTEKIPNAKTQDRSFPTWGIAFIAVLVALMVGLLVFTVHIVITFRRKFKKTMEEQSAIPLNDDVDEGHIDCEEIVFGVEISQGRYAKVYTCGEVKGIAAAAKVFSVSSRKYWQQELDVYRMFGTSHTNILRFLGSTTSGEGNNMTHSIIVAYHPLGSIYDHLKGHTLTWIQMLKIARSMMSGLAFLHNDMVFGCGFKKWSIAHRDIKSKNVLIKSDFTAAIADFGLAKCFEEGRVSGDQVQAGTHRYMAPEVLDGAISFTKDSFLRIDIYAAALVLWELLTRCEVCGNRSDVYKLPYEDEVKGNITAQLQVLQNIVSKEKRRPEFPDTILTHKDAVILKETIEESWDHDAEARLSAGCVELRLVDLYQSALTDSQDFTTTRNLRNLHVQPDSSAAQNSPLLISEGL